MIDRMEFGELKALTDANAKAIEKNTKNIDWLFRTAILILIGLVVTAIINPIVEKALLERKENFTKHYGNSSDNDNLTYQKWPQRTEE